MAGPGPRRRRRSARRERCRWRGGWRWFRWQSRGPIGRHPFGLNPPPHLTVANMPNARSSPYAAAMSAWTATTPPAGNRIHPTAVIGPEVELGDDNVIGAYAVLLGPATIGSGNWIGPHAVVGTPGESRGATHPSDDAPCGNGIVVGDGNVL